MCAKLKLVDNICKGQKIKVSKRNKTRISISYVERAEMHLIVAILSWPHTLNDF